jgi:hypothetical protein
MQTAACPTATIGRAFRMGPPAGALRRPQSALVIPSPLGRPSPPQAATITAHYSGIPEKLCHDLSAACARIQIFLVEVFQKDDVR